MMLRDLQAAWKHAGVAVETVDESGRLRATVARKDREPAFSVAIRALEALGCRTCADRTSDAWSIFGFSEDGCIRIDLLADGKRRLPMWRRIAGQSATTVALLGPDGVGKSTTLRLVREWFEREAPFVNITLRQWRPALLPPLASLLGKGGDGEGDQRPRRNPGNMQWLRLFYYFVDYVAGSWWKDRDRGDNARLIIYDRCGLDMTVDPYRFALKSRRGTALLWKITPRPGTLLLLYDTARRIAKRKDDLAEHEVAEQLESWLKLVAQDEVHAVIQVDADPQEIANRVRDLMIDAFVRHHEHGFTQTGATAADVSGECAYAALPSLANPRFLIPLANRKVAAASLAIYNAQRMSARAMKALLRFALRTGVVQIFQRHRIGLGPLAGAPSFLSRTIGYENVSIAVSLGTPGPNRKPALQIMDRDGGILGYAKVGSTARTIASIRNEEAALLRLDSARFSTGAIPRVLHAGWMDENYVLVQSPATGLRSQGSITPGEKHIRFLAELHRMNASTGELPGVDERSVASLRAAGFHYYAHLIEWANGRSHEPVPFGPAHRDFTPWNIRQDVNGLLIFDWETFEEQAPAGWDLFHLLVAGAVEVDGATAGAIYKAIMQPGRTRDLIEDYFRQIDADQRLIEPLFVSYAANALCAGVLELGEKASEKDRALQRTWAALLTLTRHNGAAIPQDAVEQAAVVEAV